MTSPRLSTPERAYALRLAQPDYWNKPDPAQDARWASDASDPETVQPRNFWLLDGPPYANGEVHLGHVLNKCLKDALVRHQSTLGCHPQWRAGWDCHGLPLELSTQKREGAPDRRAPEFLSACRREATHWMGRQKEAFKRLGSRADMESPWTTMDPEREARGMSLLFDLWNAGLLVERHSPTHWCPACGSALAASELEKSMMKKDSLYAWAELLPASAESLRSLAGLPESARVGLAYWTTTPWTLPANAAFAMGETGSSALARLPDGRFALMSCKAVERVAQALGAGTLEVAALWDNQALSAMELLAASPVSGRSVPARTAPFATEDDGSGFVHVAPAFGPEDFEWAESHPELGLELGSSMGKDGRYGPAEGVFAGLDRAASCALALDTLRAKGDLLAHSRADAESQTCWRHGVGVFYRASRQWALDLDKPFDDAPSGLRGRALASLDRMVFLPSSKARNALERMLESRRFWTLSRDRHWGLPLPFLRDSNGEVLPLTSTWWSQAVEAVRHGGVEAYASMPAPEGLFKEHQCVDVWFDSGAAFETASEPGLGSPDLVVEGADQTRGWFLSSMLLGAFRSADPVFKTVVCHGFVVDEKGRKLSKSLGNAPDTMKLFEEHGADTLRLWSLSQTMGQDVVWSKKSLEQAKGELRDWRNFVRFLLAHRSQGSAHAAPLLGVEHLAMRKAQDARTGWLDGFAKGQPHSALAALASFRRWANSSWFELSKRALYCQAPDVDLLRRRALFAWTLENFLPMLAPFMALGVAQAWSVMGVTPTATLPQPLAWSDDLADQAEAALSWRDAQHKELDARRQELGEPKAKFLVADSRAQDCAVALGVGPEHLARGVSYQAGPNSLWLPSPGWECPRCRGLFASQETGLGDDAALAAQAREAFGHALCAECSKDEASW